MLYYFQLVFFNQAANFYLKLYTFIARMHIFFFKKNNVISLLFSIGLFAWLKRGATMMFPFQRRHAKVKLTLGARSSSPQLLGKITILPLFFFFVFPFLNYDFYRWFFSWLSSRNLCISLRRRETVYLLLILFDRTVFNSF